MRRGRAVIPLLALIIAGIGLYSYLSYRNLFYFVLPGVTIENLKSQSDYNGDGICDSDEIVGGARMEVINKTRYKSNYYQGGYPPDNEGVCTDVIWRALKNAGYDLKSLIDSDIKAHTADYTAVNGVPDPNIDFRRVKNQYAFFKKYAKCLTTEVILYNKENLEQWQPGDFVTLMDSEHIAVISDKRRKDGVPYIIHNGWGRPREQDLLMKWRNRITGHFRYSL